MLEDRSYMRDDPMHSRWSATTILMVAVVTCFALQQIVTFYVSSKFIPAYLELSTQGIRQLFLWQLITFQFLHGGLMHLFCNILGLWVFGRFVEQRLGTHGFLKVYFLSGIIGGLLQTGLGFLFEGYFGRGVVGASAGVCGLLAVFALLEPESEIRLFGLFPIKAKHLLLVSGAIAAFFTVVPTSPGYAHAAHLGGYLTGIAFMRWDFVSWQNLINPFFARRRKRQLVEAAAQITRVRTKREPKPGQVAPEEFISREVDPILDKISAHGIHSLTPREREILEAARSKMAKR